MKNDSKIYKILTGLIILLLIYIFITRLIPEYFYAFGLLNGYYNSKEQLEKESCWREEMVETKREINEIKSRIEEINLKLPSDRELSIPAKYLDSLRVKNKISLQRLEIISTDSTRQYKFIKFKVTLKSRFENIKNFIEEIEKSIIMIIVEGIDIRLSSLFSRELEAELIINILLKKRE